MGPLRPGICQLILVVEQIDYMTDDADVLADKAAEAVVSQAPAVNEVAIAAADCYFPVKGLMYLMDYVHIFIGVEWWGSIVATSIMIRLFTLPFMINQLKPISKLTIRNVVDNVRSLKTGGAFWFTDLTTPDAMYILPVLMALTFWIMVKVIQFDVRKVLR